MDFEDELSAPVWDDDNSRAEVEPELSKTFADLNMNETKVEQDSGWAEEDGGDQSAGEDEIQNNKQKLMASLVPEEDPMTDLSLSEAVKTPDKGEALFGDTNASPLAVQVDSKETEYQSTSQKNHVKPQRLFSSARLRRRPLTEEQKKDLFQDPLASNAGERDEEEGFVEEPLDEESVVDHNKNDILREVNAPLFKISPRKDLSAVPSIKRIADGANTAPYEEPTAETQAESNAIHYTIEVIDPQKVGDLTSAHVEYTILSKSDNLNNPEVRVQRRYRDFRWLYRQLQNNHWGKIIPPPPEKQTVGRFKDDFIENRRFQMERMLTKISQDKDLQEDVDFVMFLQSNNFVQDSKIREHLTGSNASSDSNDLSEIHISEIELLGAEDAANVIKNGGLDDSHKGFMNLSFGSVPKYIEPDAFFVEQRQTLGALEEQLKQLCKSLDIVDVQRNDLASVTDEFAQTIKSLEELEISKSGSELLSNFAEVHMRIKESLQRSTLQEALTLGVTIDEYLRSLASIQAVFNQRSKLAWLSLSHCRK